MYKEVIINMHDPGQFVAKRQKLNAEKHDSVDKAVYEWFMNVRKWNIPIGGHNIKDKVLDLAKELNITDPLEVWLDRWKNRHVFRTVSGKDSSCTEEMTASWE